MLLTLYSSYNLLTTFATILTIKIHNINNFLTLNYKMY